MLRARPIDKHAIQHARHPRHFRRDVLTQALVIPEILGIDAADDLLGLVDELIELVAAADIQLAEPLEKLGQVLDRRVTKDFRRPVILAAQSLGEMRDQLGEFGGEGFLSQPHGFIEPALNPLAFLFIQRRVECAEGTPAAPSAGNRS